MLTKLVITCSIEDAKCFSLRLLEFKDQFGFSFGNFFSFCLVSVFLHAQHSSCWDTSALDRFQSQRLYVCNLLILGCDFIFSVLSALYCIMMIPGIRMYR